MKYYFLFLLLIRNKATGYKEASKEEHFLCLLSSFTTGSNSYSNAFMLIYNRQVYLLLYFSQYKILILKNQETLQDVCLIWSDTFQNPLKLSELTMK